MSWDDSTDYRNPTPTWRSFLIGLLAFAAAALVFAYAYGAEFSGKVSKVVDGDTLWLCDPIVCRKIRLCGINAPERGEPGYRESGDALRTLVAGASVRYIQVGGGTPCDGRSKTTSRDRIVAQCFANKSDVAAELVTNGLACDWTKFSGGHYLAVDGASCANRRTPKIGGFE